jgi:flagellar basal-body rod modification protein FlgD
MAVNSVTTTTTPAPGTQGTRDTSGSLGKDAFLKILVGQMQHQDPMAQNQDGGQMIAQMAQFSQLEQISNMAASNAKIASSLSQTGALSLIGRNVTYNDGDNALVDGVVEKVDMKNGEATLTIAGKSGIAASAVTQVR